MMLWLVFGKVQESNEESKSFHKPESLKALQNKINNDIVTVQKKVKTIKARLEEMKRFNAANKRLSECKEGTLTYRTRIAVINGLRNKLKGAHDGFSSCTRCFLDMAVTVEAQKVQMDDIEHHVMNASHYLKDDSKELTLQNSTRGAAGRIEIILLLLTIFVMTSYQSIIGVAIAFLKF
ncbi:hypothetical protein CRYUN_Cryun16bG0031200 [Craigia yunnanensis]